jgi:hypothetical protein
MSNYTHVQFLSWEIYTGPNKSPQGEEISYTGIGNANAPDSRLDIEAQIDDIFQRSIFTFKAIITAYDSGLIDMSPSTLKVFMAPEFLYRGRGGAYIHDLIDGWTKAPAEFNLGGSSFPGLFGMLQERAKTGRRDPHGLNRSAAQFNDWLFVFGTAISASFPAKENQNGKWVWNANEKGEIYNTALIQRGGLNNTDANYASRKHYISGIDFIKQYVGSQAFTDGHVVPADRKEIEPNETDREGSAIFEINGINDKEGKPIIFGIEICLDHLRSTYVNVMNGSRSSAKNEWGRIRTANKWAKIQLVPSGGLWLQTASIRLLPAGTGPTPNSYAFNCDGRFTLDRNLGAHTQIWNGANGREVPSVNKLVEASYAQNINNTTAIKIDDQISWARVPGAPKWARNARNLSAQDLWHLGAGYVRVMHKMPL